MTVYDKAEMEVHPVGYLLIWQPCNQFRAIALNLAYPPSLLTIWSESSIQLNVLASTPFYILGYTEKDPLIH